MNVPIKTILVSIMLAVLLIIGKVSAQEKEILGTKAEEVVKQDKPNAKKTIRNARFNRLLKMKRMSSLPPAEDGIHDAENDGTHMLQSPLEGFEGFPKALGGNRIDWVKALSEKLIDPFYSIEDPEEQPEELDFDIIMVVKGSMPDVLYPHDRHTQWLGCENCHDEIFVPEVGQTQISMAGILLGEKCGLCHGKVAFPVTQCRKCHSLKKEKKAKIENKAKPAEKVQAN